MRMPKPRALAHIDPEKDCPLLDPAASAKLRDATKAASDFGVAAREFLSARTPREQAAWLMTVVGASRQVFQPWCLEILNVLAVMGRSRFTALMALLGISSRTLSDKLQALRSEGLVDREIFDEQPVRIEYFLTRSGLKTAALVSPLLAHLGNQRLRAAKRL